MSGKRSHFWSDNGPKREPRRRFGGGPNTCNASPGHASPGQPPGETRRQASRDREARREANREAAQKAKAKATGPQPSHADPRRSAVADNYMDIYIYIYI